MKNICTSKIFGGLGNVLYQISTGLSYSIDNQLSYMIFNNSFGHTSHTPNISYFNNIFKNIKYSDDCFVLSDFKLIGESDHGFNDIEKHVGNVCLNGYFQSYEYFQHNKEKLLDIFNLDIKELSDDYCSIHVRRGDYLFYPHVYEILDMEYYRQAINFMGDKKFIVFTNDVEWCVNNFNNFDNVKILQEDDAYKSMSLMASCKHHIISNSTFSWWGAYLSQSENVLAPIKWFKRDYVSQISKKTYDELLTNMIPSDWKLI